MEVANGFLLVRDVITATIATEFQNRLAQVFKDKADQAKSVLLFSEDNTATFPLFVLLEDHVLISHRTAYLIYLLLHPIILKDHFDTETLRISKELEANRTKEAFERAGFKYVSDVRDRPKTPTLQIDGLAGKTGVLYVVEVKGWGLTPFYEHKKRHEYLTRDLKGVIDGVEYTTRNGKLTCRTKPSLLEKIEYARGKMQEHGFDPTIHRSVKGVVVIEDFPPMDQYKGIRIVGLRDVPSL